MTIMIEMIVPKLEKKETYKWTNFFVEKEKKRREIDQKRQAGTRKLKKKCFNGIEYAHLIKARNA